MYILIDICSQCESPLVSIFAIFVGMPELTTRFSDNHGIKILNFAIGSDSPTMNAYVRASSVSNLGYISVKMYIISSCNVILGNINYFHPRYIAKHKSQFCDSITIICFSFTHDCFRADNHKYVPCTINRKFICIVCMYFWSSSLFLSHFRKLNS